ncbi:MAG: hypothetical protein AAFP84_07580, partial [Actinomycetota bacterium]
MDFLMACATKMGRPIDDVFRSVRSRIDQLLVHANQRATFVASGRWMVAAVDAVDKPYCDQWVG